MQNKSCCVCGLVKNCAPYLDRVLANIQQLCSQFSPFHIIFSYDISSDNSLNILQEFQKKSPQNVTIIVGDTTPSEFRVVNITNARNRCLNLIRQKFANYDYFIMLDCDDKGASKMNINVLQYYLNDNNNTNSGWDALTFNRNPYYDLWALSIYPYSFSCMNFSDWTQWGRYIEKILARKKPMELIECFSAFNGFGIYRTNKFINCYYDFRPRLDLIGKELLEKNIEVAGQMYFKGKATKIDCEHRSFHFMAIKQNNAKIRIANAILFYK